MVLVYNVVNFFPAECCSGIQCRDFFPAECGPGIQCHEHAKCIRRRGKAMCRCQDPYTGDGVIECKSK